MESMFSDRGSVQEAVDKVLTIEKGMKLEDERALEDSRSASTKVSEYEDVGSVHCKDTPIGG